MLLAIPSVSKDSSTDQCVLRRCPRLPWGAASLPAYSLDTSCVGE